MAKNLAAYLEEEYDKWAESNADSGIMWSEVVGNKIQLLIGSNDVELSIPEEYPESNIGVGFTLSSCPSSIRSNVELALSQATTSDSVVSFISVLDELLKQEIAVPENEMNDLSDYDMDSDEEEYMDDDEELDSGIKDVLSDDVQLLYKKRDWLKKEEEIREEWRKDEERRVKLEKRSWGAYSNKDLAKVGQFFSAEEASRILITELENLTRNKVLPGISVEPVDDNIYHWKISLSDFDLSSNLASDLNACSAKYGYDYVTLDLKFSVAAYPFYPPLVQLIRPRFEGFMVGRITNLDKLKLANWNPTNTTGEILSYIYNIAIHGRVDLDSELNDPKISPSGAYTELEHSLMRLEVVSEVEGTSRNRYAMDLEGLSNSFKPQLRSGTGKTPEKGKSENTSVEYWAKGTGYGHHGQSTWDAKALIAAQQEKDRQMEAVVGILMNAVSTCAHNDALVRIVEESVLVPFIASKLLQPDGTMVPLAEIGNHLILYTRIFELVCEICQSKNRKFWPVLLYQYTQAPAIYKILGRLNKSAKLMDENDELSKTIMNTCKKVEQMVNAETKAGKPVGERHQDFKGNEEKMGEAEDNKGKKGEEDEEVFNEKYLEHMEDLKIDTCEIDISSKSSYYWASEAKSARSQDTKKIKAVRRELADIGDNLPIHASSSIFVRMDEERVDVMRVLITGPDDTPYTGGTWHFDVFFPGGYPSCPPKVWLRTTGGDRFRFNPNLYDNGKVCLSLLGTWSGSGSEQWIEGVSTFLQVLVSVQSEILIDDPYFNEPGYESSRKTKEGDRMSREYNENIEIGTIKHAMLDMIKSPPKGFETVIRRHYTLKRKMILKNIDRWIENGKKHSSSRLKELTNLRDQLEKAFDVNDKLNPLDNDFDE